MRRAGAPRRLWLSKLARSAAYLTGVSNKAGYVWSMNRDVVVPSVGQRLRSIALICAMPIACARVGSGNAASPTPPLGVSEQSLFVLAEPDREGKNDSQHAGGDSGQYRVDNLVVAKDIDERGDQKNP